MIKVGLTGGIACGKSTVSKMLVQKGALLLDADRLAREAVEPGQAAWVEIVDWMGKDILKEDNTLDRKKIAGLVFSESQALQRLNSIIHPRVKELYSRKSGELARQFPQKIQIWDVPLLFETGMDKDVDLIIVVAADEEKQIGRLRDRDGLSREEALRRIKSQMNLQQKVEAADFVICNNSTVAFLQEQVDRVWEQLISARVEWEKENGSRSRRF